MEDVKMEKTNDVSEKKAAFSDRLIVKAIGSKDQILSFVALLKKIYRAECINTSPLLKNNNEPGYHVFVNLFDTSPSSSNERENERREERCQ